MALEAYQHKVIRTSAADIQKHLDKYGPQGFQVVGVIKPGNKKIILILEANRP